MWSALNSKPQAVSILGTRTAQGAAVVEIRSSIPALLRHQLDQPVVRNVRSRLCEVAVAVGTWVAQHQPTIRPIEGE